MKYVSFAGLLLLLLFASGRSLSQAQTPPQQPPPASNIIHGRFIVVFNQSVDADARTAELEGKHGFKSKHVYRYALKGAVVEVSDAVANALRSEPQVRLVVPDRVMSIQPQTLPTGADRIEADKNATSDIDGDGSLANVDVAVIDTGADTTHPDLNVAGGFGQSCTGTTSNTCGQTCGANTSFQDGNGHGTHVAGTIGARDNTIGAVGIVPGARIWAVKVLGNSGWGCFSDIIAGINWVTSQAATIEVANMSLGGGGDDPTTDPSCLAIAASVAAGVTYAVAAGNSASDASFFSPAYCSDAITVSAIADFDGQPGGLGTWNCGSFDEDDTFANFSNFGAVVDIAAPGKCILSTWTGGGYNTISGTSMASPHVAGAAALRKITNPSDSPAQVLAALLAQAQPQAGPCGFTGDPDGIPEPLLYLVSTCSAYAVTWGSHNTPTTMAGGTTVTTNVSFTNSGTLTWVGSGSNAVGLSYHWYTGSCPSTAVAVWDGKRKYLGLGTNVAPGGAVSGLAIGVFVPPVGGTYCLVHDLVREGITWFSSQGAAVLAMTVNVSSAPTYSVIWGSHNTPTTMAAGTTVTANVSFTNSGTLTWQGSGSNAVGLSYHWYTGACPGTSLAVWDNNRRYVGSNVAPGGIVASLQIGIAVPAGPGTYCLVYDLVRESITWFSWQGAPVLRITVNVT